MKNFLRLCILAISAAISGHAIAQAVSKYPAVSLAGSSSNASDAVATSSTNLPAIAFMFGYNGASWDRVQVDGSKNIKVNCAVGCSAAGTFNNNADNVSSSATNGQVAAWNYVWDGANWDRLYGDQTNGAWVNIKSSVALPVTGTFWQTTQPVSGSVTVSGTATVTQGTAAGSGPWITTPWIAGAVNSATNGLYSNILQGNAVLSASNPIFTTGSIAGAAVSATNGGYVNLLQGNAVNASGNPIFAQITAGSAIVGKVGIDQTTPGTTNGVVVNSGTITTTVSSSSSITNPTSTLALPSSTSAYTIGQLLCTSATAGTCNTALASEFFSIVNSAGGASIARLRLSINDSTSTAWGAQTIQIDLWTAAPTMTNGDRGTYLLTTGSATHLATYTCNLSAVQGDGVYGECALNTSGFAMIKLASGTSVFWTADALTGSGTTGASKTVTLTAELAN